MAKPTELHMLPGSELVSRGGALLASGEYPDVEFLVGDDKEMIKAHRLLLANASPVFASMFYGPLREGDRPIPIPDAEPAIFRLMLEYIYTDTISLTALDQLYGLLYLGQKYLLANMPRACAIKCAEYLIAENALEYFDLVVMINEPALIHLLDMLFKVHTKEVLQAVCDKSDNNGALEHLFSKDLLNIDSEVDLLDVLDQLSSANKSERSSEVWHRSVGRLLKHIRFLSMESCQFASIYGRLSKYLSESELLCLFMNYTSPHSATLPKCLSSSRARRHLKTPYALALPYPRPKEITIKGYLAKDYKKFHIDFQTGPLPMDTWSTWSDDERPSQNSSFHMTVRKDAMTMASNTFLLGSWRTAKWKYPPAEKGFPFKEGELFVMSIVVCDERYTVSVNGEEYLKYRHRLPYNSVVTHLGVVGDLAVSSVEFTDELVYNQDHYNNAIESSDDDYE